MFSYLGNTINIPTTTTLVATPLPNSIALRAPYDNVSPSVSSSQLDNNASGNRDFLPKENSSQNISANSAAENFSVDGSSANSPSYSNNAQTSFLAQLAAGDISPEVRGLFAQYDRLVSYANVKYKPSNAGKPVDPVAIFKTLMQMEKEADSHNLPEDLPVDLPSDLTYVQNISSAPQAEPHVLQEVTMPRIFTAERKIYPENQATASHDSVTENLTQASIKLYKSAIDESRYTIPENLEVA